MPDKFTVIRNIVKKVEEDDSLTSRDVSYVIDQLLDLNGRKRDAEKKAETDDKPPIALA